MKKILVILTLGMMICTMSASESMKGLGKDVEDAGEWVQEKAE